MLRYRQVILFVHFLLIARPLLAQEVSQEAVLAAKIELLGGVVIRDETQPGRPVVSISFAGSPRFNEKYLHLLKGFSHLDSVDFGRLQITEDVLSTIDDPRLLAIVMLQAGPHQFEKVYSRFRKKGDVGLLVQELEKPPFPDRLPSSAAGREIRAKRQSNAAVVLFHMNQPDRVWPLLRHTADPRLRSYLIHQCAVAELEPSVLVRQLNVETDISIRRALVLCLGEYREDAFSETTQRELIRKLREIYQTDSDAGMHSAVEWFLRKRRDTDWLKQAVSTLVSSGVWKSTLANAERAVSVDPPTTSPLWYVNSQAQTMAVIPGPINYVMGSPDSEPERAFDEEQHREVMDYSFAISTTPVTAEQYQRFQRAANPNEAVDDVRSGDLPAVKIDWLAGARYCNWLSDLEGLQKCFEINGDHVMAKSDYPRLNGYRFPSEAEMEYAMRAGSTSCRFYGETEELLAEYAWYRVNSEKVLAPVAQLKPNDFGLFDVYGNASIWCLEYYRYPKNVGGKELPLARLDEPGGTLAFNPVQGSSCAVVIVPTKANSSSRRTDSVFHHIWQANLRVFEWRERLFRS